MMGSQVTSPATEGGVGHGWGTASCCGLLWFWRCSGVLYWRECLDDDQLSAATLARQCQNTERLIRMSAVVVIIAALVWRFGPEKLPDPGYIGGTVAGSEEAIVANAVLALGEHMDQEAADEL